LQISKDLGGIISTILIHATNEENTQVSGLAVLVGLNHLVQINEPISAKLKKHLLPSVGGVLGGSLPLASFPSS
jgi:hypothetical protein